MPSKYDSFVGQLYEYNKGLWFGVQSDDHDAYGIVSDEQYLHDYPSYINRYTMTDGQILYKPKQLIPFSTLGSTELKMESALNAILYINKVQRECERYDNLVRNFDGQPYPSAIYKTQLYNGALAILMNVKKNKRRGGWVNGYLFYASPRGLVGKLFKAPYSEFDLSELKLFTESGNEQPKFKGCLSIEGFNKYRLDFKNKINNVRLNIRMVLSEYLDFSKLDEEESHDGN